MSTPAIPNIAVFVDGDNFCPRWFDDVAARLGAFGKRRICKVFGRAPAMRGWQDKLESYNITAVPAERIVTGKNAADMLLTIDVIETLYTKPEIDVFCLASSDSDFAHLATRLRAAGKLVLGFGDEKAPPQMQICFDKFMLIRRYPVKQIEEVLQEYAPKNEFIPVREFALLFSKKFPNFRLESCGVRSWKSLFSRLVDTVVMEKGIVRGESMMLVGLKETSRAARRRRQVLINNQKGAV